MKHTYAQRQAALALCMKHFGAAGTVTKAVFDTIPHNEKNAVLAAINVIKNSDAPEKLKSSHKIAKKESQAALDAKANQALADMGISTDELASSISGAVSGIKTSISAGKNSVKNGMVANFAAAIDEQLQTGIIERARQAAGLLGKLIIIPLASAKFRPAPVEVTTAQAVKWKESTTLPDFTYNLNDTPNIAQVGVADSGFMAKFLASDEAIKDPHTDIVALSNRSIDKSISEAQATEITIGDSEAEEFFGAFTDLIDVHGSYHEAFKPDADRFIGTFGAIKSEAVDFGGYDIGVADNAFDNILRLINSMPVNDREGSVFVLSPDDFTELKSNRTIDTQGRLTITETSIAGYPVVLDDNVPSYFIAFGQPEKAIGVGVHFVHNRENPYVADGAVTYTRKARLKNWVIDNGKLRFMLPVVSTPLSVEAGRGLDLDYNEMYQLQGSVNHNASMLTDITWTQTAGTTVVISDNKVLQPTITTLLADDTITFELSCTDSDTNTVTDTVTFTVTDQLVVSLADATGTVGSTVTLDGVVDSHKYDVIDRKIEQLSGDVVGVPSTISGSADIRFTAVGVYTFSFTATDEHGNTSVATNTVTIS